MRNDTPILLGAEIKGFLRHRRSLHVVPLLCAGVVLVPWISPVGSPVVPIVLAAAAGLEPQFNNIFFRSPNEPDALGLFPADWRRIVLVKNVSAALLFVATGCVLSMALLYFSPRELGPGDLVDGACYGASILFPLLTIGNAQSLRNPRKNCGLATSDFHEAIWMLANLAIASLPFYVCADVVHLPALAAAYGAATAIYWYRVSLPRTARGIERERVRLCNL